MSAGRPICLHSLLLAVLVAVMPNDPFAAHIMSSIGLSRTSNRPQPFAAAVSLYNAWHECNSQAVYGGLYGAETLSNLTYFRSNLLSHIWASFDPSVPFLQGHQRFEPVKPFVTCPPHQPLTRYGNPKDGGKLLCDLSKLTAPCIIYSLGSNGDYSFEEDAVKHTQCEIHTFDCTYNGESIHPRHIYHKVCVGRAGANFRTWEEITHMLGHHHKGVDVAKIDIEGHEPAVLAELRAGVQLPRQIVIELHFRPQQGATAIAAPAPRTPAQLALLFLHMASLGYGVVGSEDNIWGEAGCCSEFTLLLVERQWLGMRAMLHEVRLWEHQHASGGLGGVQGNLGMPIEAQSLPSSKWNDIGTVTGVSQSTAQPGGAAKQGGNHRRLRHRRTFRN
eukprot:GHRR01001481.1.p1 GENE.GHRR01001481.1~~GHRR01001481.1.p1  ORF type:complete len:390 (+),score=80.39 GHRR01001481.1:272-1441(+)